jgi:hypothetical protein
MMRSPRRGRAYAPDPDAPDRECDMPDCHCAAEYRAPKSRDHLREYFWFCLDHVRAYNARWDYYKGMSPGQIEANLRADSGWQRPTWPLGHNGSAAADALEAEITAFGLGGTGTRFRPGASAPLAPPELRDALSVMGLAWPVTRQAAKSRYKELAKRHHPDANGGDKNAEEKLKTINIAYAALRDRLPAVISVPSPA